jgi:hypothetical protein
MIERSNNFIKSFSARPVPSQIFDPRANFSTGFFQICDVVDPEIKKVISARRVRRKYDVGHEYMLKMSLW